MKYYLVGIKGSGMTALASILKGLGAEVLGSDVEQVFFTEESLIKNNIKATDFDPKHITDDIDCVIVGNAFAADHPQVLAAKALNVRVATYKEFLNELSNSYTSIAVAGTNGKTTTTSMIVSMFGPQQVSYLIGDGNGYGNTDAEYFVFEACEYKNTFYTYHPKYGIINNIEMDHPDFFKDINDVINSFQNFADNCEYVIMNADDLHSKAINHNQKLTFSCEDKDATLYFELQSKTACGMCFDLTYKNVKLGTFALPFYGTHMIYNSLATILLGLELGNDIESIIGNLAMFKGAKRRFETYDLDVENSLYLIDDYAHHPTAIEHTINAVRQKYPDFEVTVLFQPHTYSRTKEFLNEFAQTLSIADNLFLVDIFGSIRESNQTVTIDELKAEIIRINKTNLLDDLSILDTITNNHIICLLGAGDIDKLYLEQIRSKFKGE